MSDSDWTILECSECQSKRAGIIASTPPTAKCADCGHIYDIVCLPDPPPQTERKSSKQGERHRQDKGPQTLGIQIVKQPEGGILTQTIETLVGEGPEGVRRAMREAGKVAARAGEELLEQFRLVTPWLQERLDGIPDAGSGSASSPGPARLLGSGRAGFGLTCARSNTRRCGREALRWRPRFLAALSLSHSVMIATRSAGISPNTWKMHRDRDAVFAEQIKEAEEMAADLLESACWKSAIEGDLEPQLWQGITVGWVRKYDSKLRIELLRAHRPSKFKTPGTGGGVTIMGDGNNVMVLTEQRRLELVDKRRAALVGGCYGAARARLTGDVGLAE